MSLHSKTIFLPETCLNYVGEGNSSATNKQRVNRGYHA